jgi:hypothetical protein
LQTIVEFNQYIWIVRFQQITGFFFLIVVFGSYTCGTFIAIWETGNASELADFPFDSEEQEEESKEGKEKEKEEKEEKDKKHKEVLLSLNKADQQIFNLQNRKCQQKHLSDVFIEIFTPPPELSI